MSDLRERASKRWLGGLVIAVSALTACSNADFSGWKPYSPEDGAFTVSLPGTPVKERRLSKFPTGDLETDVYSLDLPDQGFITITDTVMPLGANGRTGVADILKSSVGRIVESSSGQVVYNRDVVVAGYPGREVEVDVPTAAVESGGRLRARSVVVGTHLYELICVMPNRLTANEEFNHFLDSFAPKPTK